MIEKSLEQYKKNLVANESIKKEVWTNISRHLESEKKKSIIFPRWLFLPILILLCFAVSTPVLLLNTQKQNDKTEQEESVNEPLEDIRREYAMEDQSMTPSLNEPSHYTKLILEIHGETENQDVSYESTNSFNLTPKQFILDSHQPGTTVTQSITVDYSLIVEKRSITLKVIDFTFDELTCDFENIELYDFNENSAADWVSLTDGGGDSEKKEHEVEVEITIPENTQSKTYWFAIALSDEQVDPTIEAEKYVIFFITVGESKTVDCI